MGRKKESSLLFLIQMVYEYFWQQKESSRHDFVAANLEVIEWLIQEVKTRDCPQILLKVIVFETGNPLQVIIQRGSKARDIYENVKKQARKTWGAKVAAKIGL